MEHCKEHEERTICISRLKAESEANKLNWAEGRKLMALRADRMDNEIDRKLNISTFYKIVGFFVVITMAMFGAQWSLLFEIDKKLDDVSIRQAVVMNRLEHLDGDHR